MTSLSLTLLIITSCLFAAGLIGTFLPVVPCPFLVWLGIFIHKLVLGDASVSWTFFGIATALTLIAQALDYLCSYWGAKRFGASWQGGLGAVAGGILGVIFFNILGLIIGPIAGVIIVEFIRNRNIYQAGKAGLGTIVGGIATFIAKFAIACIMIVGFYISLSSSI